MGGDLARSDSFGLLPSPAERLFGAGPAAVDVPLFTDEVA